MDFSRKFHVSLRYPVLLSKWRVVILQIDPSLEYFLTLLVILQTLYGSLFVRCICFVSEESKITGYAHVCPNI